MSTLDGYKSRMTGERVVDLLSRHFIVPTLLSPPTENTLSWEDGSYTVNFRIGELVRIYEDGFPIFYRLVDLNTNKAVWQRITPSDLSLFYTKEEINTLLEDYDAIIQNRAYLTAVPSEYVTEEELENKKYLTSHQDISGKQDRIHDLPTIREGAARGATAIQEKDLFEKVYSKIEINDLLANLDAGGSVSPNPPVSGPGVSDPSLPSVVGSVILMSPEEYENLVEAGGTYADILYCTLVDDSPYEIYLGTFLIAKKGEAVNAGFPYTFPIIFN